MALALSLVSLTGFSQALNFSIAGKVNPKYNGKLIKIYYEDAGQKKSDSVTINKSAFKLTGNISAPTLGKLSLGDQENGDRTDLFLSQGTIQVSATDSIHYSNISGTKLAEDHELLVKKIRPTDDKLFNAFAIFRKMPEGEAKKAYIAKVMSGFDAYNLFKRESIHQFAKEHPNSYVSLYYLDQNTKGVLANYETTYPYFSKLSPDVQATPLGKELAARLLAVKGKLTGQPYLNFVSTTPEGKQLSLKEVLSQNKYTLVDFWASWCGPCRKENPNVVKAYNAFKEKGFTVLSVSLDEDATKWKAAIEKDGMPWYHVSSLKGWKEPAAELYGIRAIPQNVLVDAEGKVVATNLRAETLYKKIQELTN